MTLVGDHRRTRNPSAPVTAAARTLPIRPGGKVDIPAGAAVDDKRLWGYYRDVDVVHFGMGFKRNAVLRAKFMPAKMPKTSGDEPEPIEDGAQGDDNIAVEVFQGLDGGRGRIADVMADIVVHLDVAGICYPVYQRREAEDGVDEDRLTVYSTLEIKKEGSQYQRLGLNGSPLVEDKWQIKPEDTAAIIWRPSPDVRSTPDAPLRAVADECDLLLSISAMFQATMVSRINNGILVIPDSMRPPQPPVPVGQDPNEPRPDPFIQDMTAALGAAISQPNHPSRFQPYILSGPDDSLGRVQKIDLGRLITPQDLQLLALVQGRVATGLDLPPEIIEGLSNSNHWTGWLVDAAAYRQHVDPTLLLGLDGFTRKIYWPQLKLAGVKAPEQYAVWRDISSLTTSPNRVGDAIALWDRGIIKSEPVRAVAGYDETDAREDNPDPVPGDLLDDPDPSVGPARSGPPGRSEDPTPGRQAATTARRMPQDEPKAPVVSIAAAAKPRLSGRRLTSIDRTLTIRLSDAAEAASQRALDKAGAKVRSRGRGDATLTAMLDKVPNRLVGVRLGAQLVGEQLALTAAELIDEDDFKDFEDESRRLLTKAQDAAAAETSRLVGAALTAAEVDRDREDEARDADAAVAILMAAILESTRSSMFTPGPEADPADLGELGDARVLSGRTLLDATTTAGGGLSGLIPDAGGFDFGVGNGPRSVSQLRARDLVTLAWVWDYGSPSLRKHQFVPHVLLDGIEFDQWDDPALENKGTFPRGLHLHPGDHAGCLCGAERILWHL